MQLTIRDLSTVKKVPPCCSFLPLLYIILLVLLTLTPTCPVTNCLSVTFAAHPFLSVDLHPHTQCLSNPPCFFSPPFALLPPVCLSIPQTDSSDSDLELSTVRHQPEGLDQLQAQTKFTRKELQSLYRGFKNVCLSVGFSAPWVLIQKRLIIHHRNISFFPWAGVSQWNGGWGDIQDHLFSVLSPRRSESFSKLNILF